MEALDEVFLFLELTNIRKDFGFLLGLALCILYLFSAYVILKRDKEDAERIRFQPR
jgi:hypothetical protein